MGIGAGGYAFADGSGLSRLNLVSADAFVRVLRFMYGDRNFQKFLNALPVAGVDGTLSERMKGTKAENNVHAKTGTITNVSSISGYVKNCGWRHADVFDSAEQLYRTQTTGGIDAGQGARDSCRIFAQALGAAPV